MAVNLKYVFRLDVELAPALEIGATQFGLRRVIPIVGGTFTGERISGRILPGGADWNVIRPDGTVDIYARYTIETNDGVLISVENKGIGRAPAELMARIFAGQPANLDEWYSRTSPTFEVSDPRYNWLRESMFVGDLLPPTCANAVSIEIYEVL